MLISLCIVSVNLDAGMFGSLLVRIFVTLSGTTAVDPVVSESMRAVH